MPKKGGKTMAIKSRYQSTGSLKKETNNSFFNPVERFTGKRKTKSTTRRSNSWKMK
jgi:hypothetical protein